MAEKSNSDKDKKAGKNKDWTQTIRAAKDYVATGNLFAAASTYQEILTEEPDHSQALFNLGVLERKRGNASQAIELLTARLNQGDTSHKHVYQLGVALQEAGEPQEAIAHYEKARKMTTNKVPFIWERAGTVFIQSGDFQNAIAMFEKSMELSSKKPTLEQHLQLGNAYKANNEGERAAAHFEKVLEIDPSYQFERDFTKIKPRRWSGGGTAFAAAALAIVTIGFAGHKNGWFKSSDPPANNSTNNAVHVPANPGTSNDNRINMPATNRPKDPEPQTQPNDTTPGGEGPKPRDTFVDNPLIQRINANYNLASFLKEDTNRTTILSRSRGGPQSVQDLMQQSNQTGKPFYVAIPFVTPENLAEKTLSSTQFKGYPTKYALDTIFTKGTMDLDTMLSMFAHSDSVMDSNFLVKESKVIAAVDKDGVKYLLATDGKSITPGPGFGEHLQGKPLGMMDALALIEGLEVTENGAVIPGEQRTETYQLWKQQQSTRTFIPGKDYKDFHTKKDLSLFNLLSEANMYGSQADVDYVMSHVNAEGTYFAAINPIRSFAFLDNRGQGIFLPSNDPDDSYFKRRIKRDGSNGAVHLGKTLDEVAQHSKHVLEIKADKSGHRVVGHFAEKNGKMKRQKFMEYLK